MGTQPHKKQQSSNKKAAPEFDHAYSYVSKIKQRFAHQQTVYQQFLQILQRYKEEVCACVFRAVQKRCREVVWLRRR
jgi:histone deacetylase complex regulatory component SIN3